MQSSRSYASESDTCSEGQCELSLLQLSASAANRIKSTEPELSRLPTGHQMNEEPAYKFSSAQLEAGHKFLEAPSGTLATEALYAMDQLFRYWAKTMQNITNHTVNAVEKPDKEVMRQGFAPFCAALAAAGRPCASNPLDIQEGLNYARCLLEKDIDANRGDGSFLATYTEFEDQINSPIMADFFEYFGDVPDKVVTFKCEGEKVAEEDDEDQALAGTKQSTAVAVAVQSRQAADRMVKHFDEVSASASSHVDVDELSRLWEGPCKALGCDAHSWLDIVDGLHGHTRELIDVAAPARMVREHIRSLRAAHRATQKGFNVVMDRSRNLPLNSTLFALQAFLFTDGKAEGSKTYEEAGKTGAGVFDASFALSRGSKEPLTRWWWCFSISAGTVIGYAWSASYGYGTVGLEISFSDTSELGGLEKLFKQSGTPCFSRKLTLGLSFMAGIGTPSVPGAKINFGCSVGISISFTASVSGCGAAFNVGVGASGGCMLGPVGGCVLGTYLFGIPCSRGAAVGVGVLCCGMDFANPGASDCFATPSRRRRWR